MIISPPLSPRRCRCRRRCLLRDTKHQRCYCGKKKRFRKRGPNVKTHSIRTYTYVCFVYGMHILLMRRISSLWVCYVCRLSISFSTWSAPGACFFFFLSRPVWLLVAAAAAAAAAPAPRGEKCVAFSFLFFWRHCWGGRSLSPSLSLPLSCANPWL